MIFRVPGPCAISWGGNDLGNTLTGIVIRTTPNWVPITDDQHGAEPADYLWAGKIITVECVGMYTDDIIVAAPFAKTLGGAKVVGEHIGQDTAHSALVITERDTSVWQANHVEPLPPDMLLTATQEMRTPLIFIVLLDSSDLLFSTIPAYVTGD